MTDAQVSTARYGAALQVTDARRARVAQRSCSREPATTTAVRAQNAQHAYASEPANERSSLSLCP